MTRLARHHHRDPAPSATSAHPDTADLREITERAVTLYSERSPVAAAKALGRGCRNQTRGGRVSIAAQMVEALFDRDPAGLQECIAYLRGLGVRRA